MDNLDDLIKKLSTSLCKPEDMLINRGAKSDTIFFISKGTIEIYIDDPRNNKQNQDEQFYELGVGQIFGEIGVLLDTKRSAFSRAQDYSILETLSQKNFKMLSQNDQVFGKILRNKMQNYKDKRTKFIKEMLRAEIFKTHFFTEGVEVKERW